MARIPSNMDLESLGTILPQLVDRGLPGGGEFLVAELCNGERTAAMIALLIWHGFLPMGGNGMLLPKIHKARCVLPPGSVHIGRKVRRRAKGFRLSVDAAWEAVVHGIQMHTFTSHEGDCWLSDELASTYQAVTRLDDSLRHGVAFHSVELWHAGTGELVAGEIGYTCGAIYSSCTGFAVKDQYSGLGSVQMAALARWLSRCGFALWDLGMELDYKLELGCEIISRAEWAERVRSLRREPASLLTPTDDADADAATLVAGGGATAGGAAAAPAARVGEEGDERPEAAMMPPKQPMLTKKERREQKALQKKEAALKENAAESVTVSV